MSNPTYVPQAVELIVDTPDGSGGRDHAGPGGADTPAHEHSAVEEVCYCLAGELTCEADGTPPAVLRPGERKRFAAGLHHRLANPGPTPCRFLLVHGVGRFDFVPTPQTWRATSGLAGPLGRLGPMPESEHFANRLPE